MCLGSALACGGLLGGPSAEFSGPHLATIQSMDIADDGSLLITGSQDRSAKAWTFPGLEGLRDLPHEDFVVAVAVSPDGSRVATGGYDPEIRIWSTATWEPVGAIPRSVFDMDWSGDHLVLAVKGGNDAEVWSTATFTLEHTLSGHADTVHAVRFSADGSRIATGSKDHSARLWDVETGEELGMFAGHSGVVLAVQFSPDAAHLATGASDKTARLWDVATQEPLKQLSGHADWIVGIDYRPDGSALVTAARDGSMRLWDARSGAPIEKLDLELGALEDVRFADADTLVTVGKDVYVRGVGELLVDRDLAPPAKVRRLDERCSRLVECGKALIRTAQTNEKGVEVVRMAREIDVESPEMCLTTLLTVGQAIGVAPPEQCVVTE
ncbi:MAG: WD40 repeat domain-containing protein [Myxococcota bacterium]